MKEAETVPTKNYSRIAYLADYRHARESGLDFFSQETSLIPNYFSQPTTVDRYLYFPLLSSGLYICLELNESGFYVLPGGKSQEGEDAFDTLFRELGEEHPLSRFWDQRIVFESLDLVTQKWKGRNGETCTDTMLVKLFGHYDKLDPQSSECVSVVWVRIKDCFEIYERGGMPDNIFQLIISAFKTYYASWNDLSPRVVPDIKTRGVLWFGQQPLRGL